MQEKASITASIVLALFVGGLLGASAISNLHETRGSLIAISSERAEWLGFWGALIGAGATIAAGTLAYVSTLRAQAASFAHITADRLRAYASVLRKAYDAYIVFSEIEADDPNYNDHYRIFDSAINDANFTIMILDSILFSDKEAILYFQMALRLGVSKLPTNVRQNANDISFIMHEDISRAIAKRIELIESGVQLTKIRTIKMIDAKVYLDAIHKDNIDPALAGQALLIDKLFR